MKQLPITIFMLLGMSLSALAQHDPGHPDTLIVGSVDIDSGATYCVIPIYIACDESLSYYNVPIKWTAPQGGIYAGAHNQYFYPLTNWSDVFDTVIISQNYKRQIGYCDLIRTDNPPIFTNGARLHVWSMYFVIEPGALPQSALLDTTWDRMNGSVWFGGYDGVSEITPIVIPGYINLMQNRISEGEPTVELFSLSQNYPNPFNSSTGIEFSLPQSGLVSLVIYDIQGREIRRLLDSNLEAGSHSVIWNGLNDDSRPVSSGIYFYRLVSKNSTQTNRMTLLR
jgi:hypothetical protein